MLIQKTFHLRLAAAAARARLANVREYRLELPEVHRAERTEEGALRFGFNLPCGFVGELELESVPGQNPNQLLFQSRDGNVDAIGMLEYFAIKPDLTEIVLTVEYLLRPAFHRFLDAWLHQVDHFLNRQLTHLEAHFARPVQGIRADRNLAEPINGHEPFAEPG